MTSPCPESPKHAKRKSAYCIFWTLHSHFTDLLAVITQDLEEPIKNFWQVIQKINIRDRLENQDLAHEKGRKTVIASFKEELKLKQMEAYRGRRFRMELY